jgi:hypothetical protein
MSTRTLFLAWQDNKPSKAWFPVGRLDADAERSVYRFRYIGGAKRAQEEVGFPLLIDFPNLNQDYRSAELFPLFQNRVMNPARPDFIKYLHRLDLTEEADPIEILSTNGGHRVTDAYEVFPKIEKDDTGSFSCRFFLHGWRHINEEANDRINRLEHGEELYVTLELTNPATELAVQMQTTDYYMIGWAPRYLVADLVAAMAEGPGRYGAKVVRINPQPFPSKQRVLIEMHGFWDKHEPMSSKDFKLLAG